MSPSTIMWLRALHLIGIVVWMGTLLTVSRLLGFHAQEEPETVQPRFSHFERRMFLFVAIPGMLLTIGAGLARLLPTYQAYLRQPWMHIKLTLVAILLVLSVVVWRFIQDLARKPRRLSKAKYMAVHGTIGLCIVGTIIVAAVQPLAR